jgi:hypothetical protein
MGQKKTAIRQNVLDEGGNLPNAILNAVIAGYDVGTIVGDTVEVLQTGDTTTFMFEATPDALEQYAESFAEKVRAVAAELREFEYIDKPVIRRRDAQTPAAKPDARVGGESGAKGGPEAEGEDEGAPAPAADGEEGIEVESAEEARPAEEAQPPAAAETTTRVVPVSEVEIDAILAAGIERIGDGRYSGKVAIKFPVSLAGLGASVAAALSSVCADTDELAEAAADYVIGFIARNPGKFGQMDAGTAADTLEFTGMGFSKSNDRAVVSTFEVGGGA